MLRISKLADYGAVIMNCLAGGSQTLLSASEIAQLVHLALPTTSKVLKMLVAAKLVASVRGAGGGYQLSRSAEEITVAEVITAVDGQPALTECTGMVETCSRTHICAIRSNWRLINNTIITALNSITLADMAKPLNLHPLVSKGIKFRKQVTNDSQRTRLSE